VEAVFADLGATLLVSCACCDPDEDPFRHVASMVGEVKFA
jgi:hypothetical protein